MKKVKNIGSGVNDTLKIKPYFTLFFSICFFAACDIINPEESLPAYLEIAPFTFTTTAAQGANTSKITDAWIFVDDLSLGIYALPATVPVLTEGDQKVSIFPVIRENGLLSSPIIYPFYQRFEQDVSLLANETISIQPTTNYITQNTIFELIEDFEDANHRLNGGTENAVSINKIPTKVLSGNASGQILLNEAEELEFTSSRTFEDLPTAGNLAVFLELDYKTNVEFEIGLVGIDPNPIQPVNATSYKVTLCPIEQWNKVYISFQDELEFSQLPMYKLAFRVSTDNTGCPIIDSGAAEVLIDNVKLIRFQN